MLTGAAAAFVVATRTAARPHGSGSCDASHPAAERPPPRGPKTGARAREVEEQVPHVCLRAQKALSPGERPGILAEPRPQRSDRSLRHSAGDSLPTLALSSLARSAGKEMDNPTIAFLTRSVLESRKEEEEEEEVMREDVRDHDGWNQAIGSDGVQFFWHRRTRRSVWVHPPSASRRKRKRKKRRKRRTPRTSFRPTRRRARRRLRRGHVAGWFSSHACFPSYVGRPNLLDILDGMDQNDSILCSSSTPAVATAGLVLLVFLLALCFLLC